MPHRTSARSRVRASLLTVSGGSPQSTPVGLAFPAPLAVTLTANDPTVPVDGAIITFTPPASGASAILSSPTATINGGTASVIASANSTAGSYTVTATTPGAAAGVTFALTNALFSSTTTLTGNPNPAPAGQVVTFTATVSSIGGTPSGSITFKEGATILGTGTLAGGIATFATTGLAVGSHAITAAYSGDATFAASTSAVFTEVVNAAGAPPPTGGLQFFPLPHPVRLLDTRPGLAAFVHPNKPLTANQALALPGRFSFGRRDDPGRGASAGRQCHGR